MFPQFFTEYNALILLALMGGVLPALIWLYFWLKEDESHPEPRKLILLTFFYGALMVPVAAFFQIIINKLFDIDSIRETFYTDIALGIIILIIWAGIEEGLKLLAAHYGGFIKKAYDEPIDAMVYLITAALGFAACENTLAILGHILQGDIQSYIATSGTRFIGATLLHVASSALLGIFIAFSYYKNLKLKHRYLIWGFIPAIALHVLFNSFIIRASEMPFFGSIGLFAVWGVIVLIILMFEVIKKKYLLK